MLPLSSIKHKKPFSRHILRLTRLQLLLRESLATDKVTIHFNKLVVVDDNDDTVVYYIAVLTISVKFIMFAVILLRGNKIILCKLC